MSLKLQHQNSSSSPWPSVKAMRNYYFSRKVVALDHLIYNQCNTRVRCHTKLYLLPGGNRDLICTSPDSMKHRINPRTSRILHLLPFASAEDGVSVNGSPRPTTSSGMEEMRLKLDLSVQSEENGYGLVQSLHDAARVIELGIRQQGSLSRVSWFSSAWLGGDRTGWIKVLSYQASVYSLLQAANEISSRGDERDNDINVFTQRSNCNPFPEESQKADRSSTYAAGAERTQLVLQKKKECVIERSLDKLKETSTDVWQGTQLLAIDVAVALGLLRRLIVGDELTDKEKQALRRTLTDLASVVPIGFLMLLPVTAVGHAAMLAAIQRYMPSLIPSTYGSERLDLLRQLEKVKEMETEVNPTEKADE
ncbi:hypothetical protein K7X08_015572 [Anisodus acutangulus]|uniref:Letm1 RBD domain-containing protein n=1 Tax=Anisodus acutangulus TaxID=402998 RepID=A0A9Q1LD71_9SOLA|nr:hypothetical protein K7X08_015572 [Anisodus acutangulus]